MSKPSHEELVDATADYLSAYIGSVSIDPIVQQLEPKVNIAGLTELLEYYFLLTGSELGPDTTNRSSIEQSRDDTGGIVDAHGIPVGVLDFVSLLPSRLRTLDPATRQDVNIYDGEIRGQIDWNQTIKHRYSAGDTQGQRFACRVQQRTVNTAKNRVLVDLLTTIKRILDRFDKELAPDEEDKILGWFEPWESSTAQRATLENELDNVYLSQLTLNENPVDSRELADVRNARDPLYREAAALLTNYRRLTRGNLTDLEAKRLLRMNPFAPPEEDDGTSALYELYWIFKLLDQFEKPRFKQIALERNQLIAAWEEADSEYLVFNDWSGFVHWQDERGYVDYLDISWEMDDIAETTWDDSSEDEFMRRHQSVLKHKHQISDSVFGYEYGRKTPDIVLLKLDAEKSAPRLEGIFIGEVKLSVESSYLKTGLEQLLEYGAHAKFGDHLRWADGHDGPYIASDVEILGSPKFELGYFVGHSNEIKGDPPDGIQICGFGDIPERPLAE